MLWLVGHRKRKLPSLGSKLAPESFPEPAAKELQLPPNPVSKVCPVDTKRYIYIYICVCVYITYIYIYIFFFYIYLCIFILDDYTLSKLYLFL